ncbi:MAG: histidine ammonia-lyase [Flavobacteriales bacterium]|nr:histidine ammonia-lyase [Flavobacteriales bacterium]|tara:strand:- start:17703 stop:19208 length:1506 start_codon:yes stop_codon:yes gene_type:complete
MENTHAISADHLSIKRLYTLITENAKLTLSKDAQNRILKCRAYLDEKSLAGGSPIYGVNTGFGSLCNHSIPADDLSQLQKNLVMSHACGFGQEVPPEVVKIMLFLKIQSLSYGNSGVQLETLNRLIDFYNNDILPIIYQQGSLGASGDLAPLAHLSLPLLGMGKVLMGGIVISSEEMLKKMSWEPIGLKSKEGLALLNGTQFMNAYGLWSVFKAYKLSYLADAIGSMSLEGFDGRIEPFDELVHKLRPHKGQMKTAANIREMLAGSQLIENQKEHVQDPYSFRCIPQVHGASKDAIDYACKTIVTEANSVTDNPNVIIEEDKVISAGNFHGQPLALALDHLAIALAELGNISERRTYLLVSGQRGLPPYLVVKPGLNSGLMIPQYTAASIVSQNKQLCTPASVDSIVSSNGQEDHVSMGANAATKLYQVVENVERILSIELMNAAQAMTFRKGASSDFIETLLDTYRQDVTSINKDRLLHNDMHDSLQFLINIEIDPDLLF